MLCKLQSSYLIGQCTGHVICFLKSLYCFHLYGRPELCSCQTLLDIFAVHFSALLGQSIKVYLDCLYFLVILQEMNSVWIFSALTHFSFSMFLLYFFGVGPKLHVQSTINSRKKVLTKAIWADKNGLVSVHQVKLKS